MFLFTNSLKSRRSKLYDFQSWVDLQVVSFDQIFYGTM